MKTNTKIVMALKEWSAKLHYDEAADAFGVTNRTWFRWLEGKGEPTATQVWVAEANWPGLIKSINRAFGKR